MVLSDISIRDLCTGEFVTRWTEPMDFDKHGHVLTERFIGELRNPSKKPMISPFVGKSVKVNETGEPIISYGLSSYGYDVRLGNSFKIFTNIKNAMIDPLNIQDDCFVEHTGDYCIIPPNSYILAHTMEYFCIPRDVMVVCVGKSTYARCAAIVNVTPIEPEFEGQVVIEISNASPLPLKIYAGMGISQFIFMVGDRTCETSYADRGGKYQGQMGVVNAR